MKQIQIPKKLLIIHNMAGVGRCSMSVALPIVSACGVQGCPLPTALFSNHLGFPAHYKRDLTEDMNPYMSHLDYLDLSFDGIYCGYVSNCSQMKVVNDYISSYIIRNPQLQILIDPIMGDHGVTYRSITSDFCTHMKSFIQSAHIITPNITEACLLADLPYKESNWSTKELITLATKLQQLGPKQIVITGMKDSTYFSNFVFQSIENYYVHKVPIAGDSRPGTGDIFASIISSLLLRGVELQQATIVASDFIALCTNISMSANVPVKEGVIFESLLHELTISLQPFS